MTYLLSICASIVLSTSLLCAQATPEQAQAFGQNLIQHYYNQQCSEVFQYFDATITSLEGGQEIAIQPSMEALLCKQSPLRQDIAHTYAEYLRQYAPKVYDHRAFRKAFPQWAKHLSLKPGDFFFDGAHPRAAGHTRLFVSEQQARFVLRYQGGQWIIIGI